MGEKPIHYDGSVQVNASFNFENETNEPFVLTEEIRSNLGGNPYSFEIKK